MEKKNILLHETSTKISDDLCRIERETSVLGGGGALFEETSDYGIILSCLSFSRHNILQIIVNRATHRHAWLELIKNIFVFLHKRRC